MPISGHCFSPCSPSSAHAPLSCGGHIPHTNEIINGTQVSLEILLLLSERLAHEGLALPCCSSSSLPNTCDWDFFFSWARLSHHRVPQRCTRKLRSRPLQILMPSGVACIFNSKPIITKIVNVAPKKSKWIIHFTGLFLQTIVREGLHPKHTLALALALPPHTQLLFTSLLIPLSLLRQQPEDNFSTMNHVTIANFLAQKEECFK